MASPANRGRRSPLGLQAHRAHPGREQSSRSTAATLGTTDCKSVTMTGFMFRAVLPQLNMVIAIIKRSQTSNGTTGFFSEACMMQKAKVKEKKDSKAVDSFYYFLDFHCGYFAI